MQLQILKLNKIQAIWTIQYTLSQGGCSVLFFGVVGGVEGDLKSVFIEIFRHLILSLPLPPNIYVLEQM